MGKTHRKSEMVKCKGCRARVDADSIVERGLCEGCWDDENEHASSFDPAGGDDYCDDYYDRVG